MEITVKNKTVIKPKLRVAAYARVSSGKDSMLHSLAAQVSYYSKMIQNRNDWKYLGVYADESATGTKDNRAEFKRLLEDCRFGKIDFVITKSISRFARNTVVLLETIRELKSLGVNVYFERENINSISGDGELMLTILASFAQEESFSVSENCKWRIRDKFKNGKPSNLQIYGYRMSNGKLEIIHEEAKIVRMIFLDYLGCMGKNTIVKKLNSLKIKPKYSKSWNESSIFKILRNEKYVGDMLLQKTFISNHIEKKKCKNNGELPKYFVEASHEAIIDKTTFNKVQEEISRRSKPKVGKEIFNKAREEIANSSKSKIDKETFNKVQEEISRRSNSKQNGLENKTYPFSSKITCAKCGKNYKRKINSAGTKYQKPVWICQTFNQKDKAECDSKQIPEEILKSKCAEILGTSGFNEDVFGSKIKNIEILDENLVFVFKDGKKLKTQWQNKSRKESWTEEMKKEARKKTKARYKK